MLAVGVAEAARVGFSVVLRVVVDERAVVTRPGMVDCSIVFVCMCKS